MTDVSKIARGTRLELFARGVVLLPVGLLLVFKPLPSAVAVTVAAGIFLVIQGGWTAVLLCRPGIPRGSRIAGIIYALLTVLLGLLSAARPLAMDFAWIFLLGIWQIAAGADCLARAFCKVDAGRTVLALNGIMSLLAGALLVFWPLSGLVAVTWVPGILLIMLSALHFSASAGA